MDITPALNFDKINDYHIGLKIIEQVTKQILQFKRVDEYFYLPHRKRQEGNYF